MRPHLPAHAHTVLTGLLDQSALYGVLVEIEALGLDLLELRKLTRTANHQKQATARSGVAARSRRTIGPLARP